MIAIILFIFVVFNIIRFSVVIEAMMTDYSAVAPVPLRRWSWECEACGRNHDKKLFFCPYHFHHRSECEVKH